MAWISLGRLCAADEAEDDWQDCQAEVEADDHDQEEDLEEDDEDVGLGVGKKDEGQEGREASA